MDYNLHWPEVFSMLKPNFIGIGWDINSGQLADLQFTKNGENFGVFGPLDPPKCDFRKMDFNMHWPEVFSMLKPNLGTQAILKGVGRGQHSSHTGDVFQGRGCIHSSLPCLHQPLKKFFRGCWPRLGPGEKPSSFWKVVRRFLWR